MKTVTKGKIISVIHDRIVQGTINMNRNKNFCKGTWVSKVIAETKVDARVEQ